MATHFLQMETIRDLKYISFLETLGQFLPNFVKFWSIFLHHHMPNFYQTWHKAFLGLNEDPHQGELIEKYTDEI